MLNWYEGYLDTNPVLLLAIDKMKVVLEFYFSDVTLSAQERNRKSLDVSERSQDQDHSICVSVQRGLQSRGVRSRKIIGAARSRRKFVLSTTIYETGSSARYQSAGKSKWKSRVKGDSCKSFCCWCWASPVFFQ
jgi:hypothetical protein